MKVGFLLSTCVLAIVFASSAFAAGNKASKSVYGHKSARIQHAVAAVKFQKTTPNHVAAAVATKGTLPFTGLDLGVLAGAAVLLVGVGVSLRRVTRNSPPNAS